MLSGNCQAVPLFGVVDTGAHYDSKMDLSAWQLPDNIWKQNQNYHILSLSNAFDLIWKWLEVNLGSKFFK